MYIQCMNRDNLCTAQTRETDNSNHVLKNIDRQTEEEESEEDDKLIGPEGVDGDCILMHMQPQLLNSVLLSIEHGQTVARQTDRQAEEQ